MRFHLKLNPAECRIFDDDGNEIKGLEVTKIVAEVGELTRVHLVSYLSEAEIVGMLGKDIVVYRKELT